MKYVIGTGWWSAPNDNTINPNRTLLGSERIRDAEFFELWLESVSQFTSPYSVVVVDSASPIKPSAELRDRVKWVELPFNARHSTSTVGQWSGWSRSVIVSAQYAHMSDCDVYAYVEQDCLLFGAGIVEETAKNMKRRYAFGSGLGTPKPIQQSFFLIKADGIAPFVKNFCDIQQSDTAMPPEWKFVFATWRPFVLLSNLGVFRSKLFRRIAFKIARMFFLELLPFGFGRVRPIDFDTSPFYFQHGEEWEVEAYRKKLG